MRFSTLELDGSVRRVSKQKKQRLLASGCYEMIGKIITAIPVTRRKPGLRNSFMNGRYYIPPGLAPAEVGNCKFVLDTQDKSHTLYMALAMRGTCFDPRGYEVPYLLDKVSTLDSSPLVAYTA